jgi:hypothetical protein
MTDIVNVISSIVLVLGAMACLPPTAARLVQACIPLVSAINDLRKAIAKATERDGRGEGPPPGTA